MNVQEDPLRLGPEPPDRVVYATGVLLDAQDFGDEQLYHRGRLARALAYLHGTGTVAGLKVEWQAPVAAGAEPDLPAGREEQLVVQPGLALDRLGRLIEVPATSCIRLDRWFQAQSDDSLRGGLHPKAEGDRYDGVVVDVFIRFYACERGKTPAFAGGPFDALNAVTPARLRDYYKLELVIRAEQAPPLPRPLWPDPSAADESDGADGPAPADEVDQRRRHLQHAIFRAWREGTDAWDDAGPVPLPEHAPGQDPTSVFLARIILPVDRSQAGARPARAPGAPAIDNYSRQFVYTAGALARWTTLEIGRP